MSPVDEILSQIPMQQLAGQLGVDVDTAAQAARAAVPALLGGIQANTADPGGAASFAEAVQQHSGDLVDGGVDLSQVDTSEGQKIVGHVFGANEGQVVQQLGGIGQGGSGIGQELIAKLLPILAPIVMSWLAKQLLGGNAAAPAGAPAGGSIGDVLGGLLGGVLAGGLGGGGTAPQPQQGMPDLGSLLGGLLGGGRR
ncbi:DUF937 domain-containing protein [Pseudonocardia sp. CA-107938]|uniref:DUF937 domain-containing protein n=1 Tax=Pseudonocardia sp. CA-107938 TaxID=3240021 RepID=UPI003D8FA906